MATDGLDEKVTGELLKFIFGFKKFELIDLIFENFDVYGC